MGQVLTLLYSFQSHLIITCIYCKPNNVVNNSAFIFIAVVLLKLNSNDFGHLEKLKDK